MNQVWFMVLSATFNNISITDHHDISEILLKVALNTIAVTLDKQVGHRVSINKSKQQGVTLIYRIAN